MINLAPVNLWALPPAVQRLLQYETLANPLSERSPVAVPMPHFEIPFKYLVGDFAPYVDPQIRQELLFRKNGELYARWIINPEDTKWHLEIEEYFKKTYALQLQKGFYFTGYQTASRSYVVENPERTVRFSVKTSTNNTGGNWTDKKQEATDAKNARIASDYIYEIEKHLKFDNVIVLKETAALMLTHLNQGLIVRELGPINDNQAKSFFIPGFSALHSRVGSELAAANGSNKPANFWTEHYIESTGRALGEFAARTGLSHDSPHSQNFLIEVDPRMRPTGRIVIRDLSDLYINQTFLYHLHPEYTQFIYAHSNGRNRLPKIPIGFLPTQNMPYPAWVDEFKVFEWNRIFRATADAAFSYYSGLPREVFIKQVNLGAADAELYRYYHVTSDQSEFWDKMLKYKNPKGILNCSFVYLFGG